MRFALGLLLVGCAANPALEKRIAELERRPTTEVLERRVAMLEQRLQESEEKISIEPSAKPAPSRFLAAVTPSADPVGAEMQMQEEWSPPVEDRAKPQARVADPVKIYAVPLDDSPVLAGDANSWITLVAGLQFPEPYTHKSWPVLQQLRNDYGKDLRIVVKFYVVHKEAIDSTIAGCAMARQQKLDKYEEDMWNAQKRSTPQSHWPDAKEARAIAQADGADMAAFDRDVAGVCATMKTRDMTTLATIGQRGVPAFWVNGRPLSGAQPIATFKGVIDDEKKKAEIDRGKGGTASTYYQRVVMNGLARP